MNERSSLPCIDELESAEEKSVVSAVLEHDEEAHPLENPELQIKVDLFEARIEEEK